ncbi:MAG TPA: hypothetical protein VG935_00440 [Patescibacteria group bacterium]|nr:hypothetical protein [Patescibacteria group bacterium]
MQLLILVLIFCLVVFLFSLHVLAKEDLIFVRKNVTLEALFNLAFYTAGVGLLSSRIVYLILHPSRGFFNPLVFFLFPYFPGLSLVGGIAGATAFVFAYRRKKLPNGRIFDFFAMALLASLPFGFFGYELLNNFADLFVGILLPIIYIVMLLFFVKVLLPLNIRGEIQDGSLGFFFLLIFSFTNLLAKFVRTKNWLTILTQVDVILLVLLFIAALVILILQEREHHFSK